MTDLVSVVVTTFNRPLGLQNALGSVLKQTYTKFEVLVVNDSSEEQQVKDVIDRFKDSRIHYLRNSRAKGANGARNTGVLAASGRFIAFLDDDDVWLPEKLEWQVEYLNKHKHYVGLFSGYLIRAGKNWRRKKQNITELSLKDCMLNNVSIGSSSSLIFRRSVFETAGLWDESLKRQQDKELLARILASNKIGYDDRIALKVDGHNDPHPMKSIPGHRIYFQKVKQYLEILDHDSRLKFYSYHYRRLCMYYLMLGKYQQASSWYKEALKYQKFHLRKDLKNLTYLIKSVIPNKNAG